MFFMRIVWMNNSINCESMKSARLHFTKNVELFFMGKALWSLEIVHCPCLNGLQFFPASAPDDTKNTGTMTRWTRDKESAGKIF